jgi:hypothetical protein
MRASTYPTCGNELASVGERWRQRQDLAITWLYPYPDHTSPPQLVERVHCAACQPHQQVATVVCEPCGEGPRCWQATSPRPSPMTTHRPWSGRGWPRTDGSRAASGFDHRRVDQLRTA